MIRAARTYLNALLIVTLLLTAFALGTARGQADPDQQLVLCTSHGVQTVWLDANGEPVSPPHYCAECIANVMAALVPVSGALKAPVELESDLVAAVKAPQLKRQQDHRPTARGPPVTV